MRQIKLEHEINNNQIKVTSDHTTYICIFRNRELNIDQIINNYSLVIKSAKKQGVKISYKNRVKNYLLENKKQYVHDRITYNWLFNELL